MTVPSSMILTTTKRMPYLRPREGNPNLPWLLLFGGWGAAVALIGGVGYLWLAADSIEAELKEQRPQVTIKVKPKRRNVERADAPRRERSLWRKMPNLRVKVLPPPKVVVKVATTI